ncbi:MULTISPECIES: helix-turn-helix domain-containing protein [unclassified Clostridium]|uniref:helix-turn-helix domain-containing protein n=1 Tax=unclassified Clostridium TaxID=2614128 RepID=UPI001C0CF289|nr:helix-turn-helix transcriptional regulator [Clostridium sp. CF012]MBU3145762.1 helix-turn-helix transcriptional regulator [Clostridium sp. CF012]
MDKSNKRESYFKFKGYLAENSIQQKEIAHIINISQATLSKRLNGKGGDFTIQDLKKICKTLNVKAEIFFN